MGWSNKRQQREIDPKPCKVLNDIRNSVLIANMDAVEVVCLFFFLIFIHFLCLTWISLPISFPWIPHAFLICLHPMVSLQILAHYTSCFDCSQTTKTFTSGFFNRWFKKRIFLNPLHFNKKFCFLMCIVCNSAFQSAGM